MGIQELSAKETQSVEAGNWFFFVLGAIAGGHIYDAAVWVINNYRTDIS